MSPNEKKRKERQAGPAAGAVSKPAQALKDEIHFVSSSCPACLIRALGVKKDRERNRKKERERQKEKSV